MNVDLEADPSHYPTRNRRRRLTQVALALTLVAGTIVLVFAATWFVSTHDLSSIVRPFCTHSTCDAIDALHREGVQVYYLCWHYRRNGWKVVSSNDSSMDDAKMARLAPHLMALEPNIVFLTHNNIGDSGVMCLGNITSIEFLDLGWTKIGDGSLKMLGALPLLKELYLNDTAITDAGLVDLEELKNLQLLDVSKSRVTQQGVRAFGRAAPSVYVNNSVR